MLKLRQMLELEKDRLYTQLGSEKTKLNKAWTTTQLSPVGFVTRWSRNRVEKHQTNVDEIRQELRSIEAYLVKLNQNQSEG